jgi:hypothetical protein
VCYYFLIGIETGRYNVTKNRSYICSIRYRFYVISARSISFWHYHVLLIKPDEIFKKSYGKIVAPQRHTIIIYAKNPLIFEKQEYSFEESK